MKLFVCVCLHNLMNPQRRFQIFTPVGSTETFLKHIILHIFASFPILIFFSSVHHSVHSPSIFNPIFDHFPFTHSFLLICSSLPPSPPSFVHPPDFHSSDPSFCIPSSSLHSLFFFSPPSELRTQRQRESTIERAWFKQADLVRLSLQ